MQEVKPISSNILDDLGIKWYCSDTLPNDPPPEGFMMNWETSREPGSHWIACKVAQGTRGRGSAFMHFDPLGLPEHPKITALSKRYAVQGVKFVTNDTPVQRPDDIVCGHLCILWLKYVFNEQQFKKFIDRYENVAE